MDAAKLMLLVAALCAARPASGFIHDLLLQPLQEVKHALQPQPQPQYYQYRRAVYDQPQQQSGYAGYAGAGYPSYAAGARPVVYQYTRPSTYEVGTAYSYGGSNGNPLTSFLQGSWLPWANRQPAQQPQPVVAAYAQQPQQPLQAFWNFLPWHGPNSAQQAGHPQQSGPVVSFLQNPSALLPWASSRPTVQYVTPLAPSTAAHSMHAMQAMQQAAPAGSVSALHVSTQPGAAPAEATLSASIKPLDASDADALVQEVPADVADNGVRRIAVQAVHQDDVPCA